MKIPLGAKQLFLKPIVSRGSVKKRLGIFPAHRAVVATGLETVTIPADKVHAVTGHSPEIVHRPHNRDVGAVKKFKQQPVVQIMVVKVMQLDYVGPDGFDPFNQSCGSPSGAKPLIIKHPL